MVATSGTSPVCRVASWLICVCVGYLAFIRFIVGYALFSQKSETGLDATKQRSSNAGGLFQDPLDSHVDDVGYAQVDRPPAFPIQVESPAAARARIHPGRFPRQVPRLRLH